MGKNNKDDDTIVFQKPSSDYDDNKNVVIVTYDDEEEGASIFSNNKKKFFIIGGIVLLVIVAAVIFIITIFSSPRNNDNNGGINNTPNPNSNSNIDENNSDMTSTYPPDEPLPPVTGVYKSGAKVNGIDLAGMDYDEAFQAVLADLESKQNVEFTISCDNGSVKLTKGDFVYYNDIANVLRDAMDFCNATNDNTVNFNYEATMSINENDIDTAVEKALKALNVEAKEPTVEFHPNQSEKFTYKSGQAGLVVDEREVRNGITSMLNDGKTKGQLVVACYISQPKETIEDLKKRTVLIGSHTSYSTNNANGNHNMKLALEASNGLVLAPDEVYSFNQQTGDSNLESNGYKPATVIVNGEFVQGIGGGLCQSSTTIYYAALYANLEVVSRYNHTYPSSYAKIGLDATIDYPYLDLKLKNTTGF